MYIVHMMLPEYDDHDVCRGRRGHQVEGLPAYETEGIAFRAAARLNASLEPYWDEVSYRVYDHDACQYISLPAGDWEDIPY